MAHWFDGFTTKLARPDNGERRTFLQSFGAAMGASLLPHTASAQTPQGAPLRLAQNAPSAAPPAAAADAVTRRIAGQLLIAELSLSKDNVTYQHQLALNRNTGNATQSTVISKGGVLVARIDATAAKGGASSASMSFGADVTGVKKVTLTTRNGHVFQGAVDGRAFSASGSPKQLGQIRFADGRAAPQITMDRTLSASIEDLSATAKKALSAPAAHVPTATRKSPVSRNKGGASHEKRYIPSAPGLDWFEPSNDVVDCTACETNCNNIYGDSVPSWALDVFCPPCALADVATALAIWAGCMLVCQLPGQGCLPTPCGTFTTCGKNDKCFSYKGGSLCCPAPAALCNNVCCGTDVRTCAPDGGCGCTTDQKPCGNDCCDPGQTCINGTCCDNPKATVCGGVCCAPGQTCHNGKCCISGHECGAGCCDEISNCADPKNGVCCSFAQVVCGTTCCPLGAICINGKCCGADSICGSVCCPSGQTCTDPAKHICSPCTGKNVPCLPEGGAGLCCPPGVECCIGTCCQPGQACNFTGVVNGKNTYACGAPPRIQ